MKKAITKRALAVLLSVLMVIGVLPISSITAFAASVPSGYEYIERAEPYVDDDGVYVFGSYAYYKKDGVKYTINSDGSVGSVATDDELKIDYFQADLSDTDCTITAYTGPCSGGMVLEIPRVYAGKTVVTVGNNYRRICDEISGATVIIPSTVEKIRNYAFSGTKVDKVIGNTVSLSQIGGMAFANCGTIEIHLRYNGRVELFSYCCMNDRVTYRTSHYTLISFSSDHAISEKRVNDFDHQFNELTWNWADDCSSATLSGKCTVAGCNVVANAGITEVRDGYYATFTATAVINEQTYTDTKTVDLRNDPFSIDAIYIDENGEEQTARAFVLDGTETALSNDWYIVNKDVTFSNNINISGTVNLILADGKTMTAADKSIQGSYNSGAVLNIYSQSGKTGVLNAGAIAPNYLHVYDGNINLTGSFGSLITSEILVYGGNITSAAVMSFKANRNEESLKLFGGSISTDLFMIGNPNVVALSKATDSFSFDRISVSGGTAPLIIQSGCPLTDGESVFEGNYYSGHDGQADDVNQLTGKTLRPYKISNITYSSAEYGSVSGAATANIGDEVALTVTPDEHYVLDTLTVTDSDGNAIPVTDCKFMMPGSDVTVTATFSVQTYIVNWVVNGVTVETDESVPYSTTPEFNGEFQTDYTEGDSHYLFIGWSDGENTYASNALPAVTNTVTYTAVFDEVQFTEKVEPYIDANGAYIVGNVAYYTNSNGRNYAANSDGSVGEELASVELSYFDFTLLDDDTYRVNHFTGPTNGMTELVIPKTYNGKKITVVGSNNNDAFYSSKKTQFTLVLNENITKIEQYTFYVLYVTEVTGDTSGLKEIGKYAFSWANGPGNYAITLHLDYPGQVNMLNGAFNNMNVTFVLKHSTSVKINGATKPKSTAYVFTDAHTYSEPTWTWAEDYSGATATFTCTDSRCKHQESVDATVSYANENGERMYIATVEFEGETYTDTQYLDYDINEDGFEDINDIAFIISASVDEVTMTATQEAKADLNGDRVVDAFDAAYLDRFLY